MKYCAIIGCIAVAALLLPDAVMAETHEVKMLNRGAGGAMVYEPDHLTIALRDSVHFVPTQKGHNAASIKEMLPEGATPFLGPLSKEETVRFDVAGRYGIKCTPHYAMGMVMVIDVGETVDPLPQTLPDTIPRRARERFEEILSR
ncbi:pseudoazurin [Thioclava sp. GXIMD4216]|uniref:pseudoazurin n=1 Tax=Thioclava sp. GXIMD4216 TaxID=3131929 RepID=UPI0030CDD173